MLISADTVLSRDGAVSRDFQGSVELTTLKLRILIYWPRSNACTPNGARSPWASPSTQRLPHRQVLPQPLSWDAAPLPCPFRDENRDIRFIHPSCPCVHCGRRVADHVVSCQHASRIGRQGCGDSVEWACHENRTLRAERGGRVRPAAGRRVDRRHRRRTGGGRGAGVGDRPGCRGRSGGRRGQAAGSGGADRGAVHRAELPQARGGVGGAGARSSDPVHEAAVGGAGPRGGHRAAAPVAQRPGGLRGGAGRGDRPSVPERRARGGAGLRAGVHVRQRRQRPRLAA